MNEIDDELSITGFVKTFLYVTALFGIYVSRVYDRLYKRTKKKTIVFVPFPEIFS